MHDRRRPCTGPHPGRAAALLLLAASSCAVRFEETAVRPRVLAVEVTPATATLRPGDSQVFTARVLGEGTVPQLTLWRLGGADLPAEPDGSVRVSSPATGYLPAGETTLRVEARSAATPSVSGAAVVVFAPPRLTLTPGTAEVLLGDALQFTATSEPPAAVAWSCTAGTIDSAGLYRAPATALDSGLVVVAATTAQGRATAQVTLRLPAPLLTGYTWSTSREGVLVLQGERLDAGRARVFFPDGLGQDVTAPLRSGLEVIPPAGVANGSIRVRLETPDAVPAESNRLPFTHTTRVRLRAERLELAAGESTRLQAVRLRGDPAAPITLSVSAGTLAGEVLTAPAAAAATQVQALACGPGGGWTCGAQRLPVLPFRVEPSPALVPAGGTLQLTATTAGAPLSAGFSLVAGGGSATVGGSFTAPAGILDSGTTWLQATDGTSTLPVPVGVTGLTPGTVGRIVEAMPLPGLVGDWGTTSDAVAVGGGRLYVAAGPAYFIGLSAGLAQRWIDVYDLADPVRPAWIGSVPSGAGFIRSRLVARGPWLYSQGEADVGVVEIHDLSGPLPVLAGRRAANLATTRFRLVDEYLVETGAADPLSRLFPLRRQRLADGPAAPPLQASLALPGDYDHRSATGSNPVEASAIGGRVYALYPTATGGAVATWDAAVDPPSLLGNVAAPAPCGDLTSSGPFLQACGRCWETRAALPAEIPCPGQIVDFDGTSGVALQDGDILRFDDAGAAAPPRVGARVSGGAPAGALATGRYYSPGGAAGLSIHDLQQDGGPLALATGAGPGLGAWVLGSAAGGIAYLSGLGRLAAWDTTTTPPRLLWEESGDDQALDLALAGNRLILSTFLGLAVRPLRDPAAPGPATLVPLRVSGGPLAVDGTLAWVADGDDLVAVDLAGAAGPAEVGRLAMGGTVGRSVVLGPGRLLVVSGLSTLSVVRSSNPAAPRLASSADLGLTVVDLTVEGNLALVTTPGSRATVDIADTAAPVVLAEVAVAPTSRIVASNGIAWLEGSVGFSPREWLGYDLRSPARPRLVSRFHGGRGLIHDGTRAFTSGDAGLAEWDMAQPRNVILEPPAVP